MCGFSGILFNNDSWRGTRLVQKCLDDMSKVILHRGPDDHSKFISEEDKLGLTFQRLSILDLSISARQPMLSKCRKWIIIYNGEIYNFKELRKKINTNKNYWKTTSDTEVVLECIVKFGFPKAVEMLNGMFAIAAYCFQSKAVWLARDKFGEKPIYYSFDQKNGFFFSSEIKCLQKVPFFKKNISIEAISNYLRYGYVPDPLSILKNTFKLEAGTLLKFSNKDGLKTKKYWDSVKVFNSISEKKFKGSFKDAANEAKERLDISCKNRLTSDVPIGLFLSGGIDSSNLAYSLYRQNKSIETFSVGFDDKKTNELKYAREIAKKLETKHNEILIEEKECLNEINNVTSSFDEPFSDPSQIPTFLLSKFTRKKVKVAISGDGADELFGGYPRYQKISKAWYLIKKYPPFFRKILNNLSFKMSPSHIKIINSFGKKIKKNSHLELKELYKDEMSRWRPDEDIYNQSDLDSRSFDGDIKLVSSITDFRSLMLRDIITYLPSNLLVKADRASMANSLEVRNPFLDDELVKFAWSLPDSYINFNIGKAILKNILLEKFSTEFINRPKQGFEPPLGKWMRGPLKNWITDILLYDDGFLNKKKIETLFKLFLKGENKLTYKLWTIIMFKTWKLENYS